MKTEEMLQDCQEAASCSNTPLSKWEQDFIDSITEQYEERRSLSSKQVEVLKRIWDKI